MIKQEPSVHHDPNTANNDTPPGSVVDFMGCVGSEQSFTQHTAAVLNGDVMYVDTSQHSFLIFAFTDL